MSSSSSFTFGNETFKLTTRKQLVQPKSPWRGGRGCFERGYTKLPNGTEHDESAAHLLERIEKDAKRQEVRASLDASCDRLRTNDLCACHRARCSAQARREALRAQVAAMDAAYAGRPRREQTSFGSNAGTAGGSSRSSRASAKRSVGASSSSSAGPPIKRRSSLATPPPPSKVVEAASSSAAACSGTLPSALGDMTLGDSPPLTKATSVAAIAAVIDRLPASLSPTPQPTKRFTRSHGCRAGNDGAGFISYLRDWMQRQSPSVRPLSGMRNGPALRAANQQNLQYAREQRDRFRELLIRAARAKQLAIMVSMIPDFDGSTLARAIDCDDDEAE